ECTQIPKPISHILDKDQAESNSRIPLAFRESSRVTCQTIWYTQSPTRNNSMSHPRGIRSMSTSRWKILFSTFMAWIGVMIAAACADGPTDNLSETVRPVPRVGIELSVGDRRE